MKPNNWKTKLMSRKFWVPMVTAVVIWFDSSLEIEQVVGIITAVAAFVFGEAHVDATAIKGDIGRYISFLENSLTSAVTKMEEHQDVVDGVVDTD